MSQLDELKKYATVVTDTGDIESIRKFAPQDAITNPPLVLKATQLPQCQPPIADVIGEARRQGGSAEIQLTSVCGQVAVDIDSEVLRHIPGRISIEVDTRSAWGRGVCAAKARELIRLHEKNSVGPERILIKLAVTWEGIRTAEELERNDTDYNLALLLSFTQTQAYAEAGVLLISPFVGCIYDWYQKYQPQSTYQVDNNPGVVSMHQIYQYYKSHGYDTVVMSISFRRVEQIKILAGCDRLTISPALLDELMASEGVLTRQLTPGCVMGTHPNPMTQTEFLWQHHQDPTAVEKLMEGIRLFAADQVKLEQQIQQIL